MLPVAQVSDCFINRSPGAKLVAVRGPLVFLAVNALLVAMNALAACALLGLFSLGGWLAPGLMEMPWITYPLGILGMGGALFISFRSIAFIDRWLSRNPGRARA